MVAMQLLGQAHRPTLFTGSTATYTANTMTSPINRPLLQQNCGSRSTPSPWSASGLEGEHGWTIPASTTR